MDMLRKMIVLLVLGLSLAACQGATPAETETPTNTEATLVPATASPTATAAPPTATATQTPTLTPTPTPELIDVGPDEFQEGVNPLTGLAVADADLLERKPLAVKVQLFPRFGRPPFGINSADIVYEYYQNGGITRLHAIFYGQDSEQVGPIRSARMADHDLILMYKSIFAYGSADRTINNRLLSASYWPYLVLEGGTQLCPPTAERPMCRMDPNGQNLLMTGTAQLVQSIAGKNLPNERQDLTGMRFTTLAPEGGEAVERLTVRFSADAYTRWEYDQETKRYIRWQDTVLDDGSGEGFEILVDRLTDEPVAADNVVVLLAAHSYLTRTAGNEIIEIALQGTGDAYLLRNGMMYKVTWSRAALDSVVTLVDEAGELVPFKPGTTWFEVLGTSATMTEEADVGYRFQFSIP
jgi:hypothetical protein